ncbi:MAG TPA: calcium/sodium antiporter [Planctomycetota bacterium]|nr:calcium/sodium antiporter [Planctomycetota bacterium]
MLLGFLGGLTLLIAGAEALVRGASRLAASFGVSPLVIGLTVVAFGTSAPEMAVSVQAARAGNPDLAFGNVAGSNICNVLLILGLSACVAPLVVAKKVIRQEVPVMIGVTLVAVFLAWDGVVGRVDGLLLVAGLLAYATIQIVQGRREGGDALEEAAAPPAPPNRLLAGLAVLFGLAMLVLGSRLFVGAATDLARLLGLSDLVIGLTVVALGTSLPEVATSVLATVRGERDIAVGNVVGSNVFNLLGVLGLASAASSHGVPVAPGAMAFDVPVMVATAVACLPIFFTGHRISRWEGVLFLGYYGAYVAYLVLAAARHDALHDFTGTMAVYVLPLTVVTIGVSVLRAVRARRTAP